MTATESYVRPLTSVRTACTMVLVMNVHVTLSLDPKLLEEFDVWCKQTGAKSRSEAVAKLIERAIKERHVRIDC